MMGYPMVMGRRPMQWAPGAMPVHLQQQPHMMRQGGRQNNVHKSPRSPRGSVNGRGFQGDQQQYFYQQGRGPNPRGWTNNFRQYQGYRGPDEAGNVMLDESGMEYSMDPMNGGISDDNAQGGEAGEGFLSLQDGMMMMDIQARSHDEGDGRNRKIKRIRNMVVLMMGIYLILTYVEEEGNLLMIRIEILVVEMTKGTRTDEIKIIIISQRQQTSMSNQIFQL